MTPLWVLVPAMLSLATGQLVSNGYINPLFLPRPQARGGRLYDPWAPDPRDLYRDRGLPYDSRFDDRRYPSRFDDLLRYPNRYEDLRRYPNRYDDLIRYPGRLDDLRRYPSTYEDLRRYPSSYDDLRRYPNTYEDLRRYPNRLDDYRRLSDSVRRVNDLYRQFPEDVRYLATTARPEVLAGSERVEGGQLLSTATPDLAVTVQPNGSA